MSIHWCGWCRNHIDNCGFCDDCQIEFNKCKSEFYQLMKKLDGGDELKALRLHEKILNAIAGCE